MGRMARSAVARAAPAADHSRAVTAHEVVDGVWWLRGARGANVYALRLRDGALALVDCGVRGSQPAIASDLRAAGLDPAEVLTLLLTHRHPDHAGGAGELRESWGVTVVAGAGDVEAGVLRTGGGSRRRRRGSVPAVDVALPMDRESEPAPGVIAIPAPGHTAGSVCYLLPDRELMFIGDVALHSGDRFSRPLPPMNDDTAMQERSLRAIAARAPRHGAPGHGEPLRDAFDGWLRELASKPPAPGPWPLRLLLNPRLMWRFMRGSGGR